MTAATLTRTGCRSAASRRQPQPRSTSSTLPPAARSPASRTARARSSIERSPRRSAPFATWSDDALDERRRLVNAFIERVVADADTLAPLITREQGKPLAKARSEINSAVFFSRGYAAVTLTPEVLRDTPQQRVELRRRPARRGRRDHGLELPGAAGDVEDRAGGAGRQHGGAQAFAAHAGGDAAPGRAGAGGLPARRGQRRLAAATTWAPG